MIRIFHILTATAIGLFLMISFSSVVYIYDQRTKIRTFITDTIITRDETRKSNNFYWAKEIMNGGYILHFRHAERDKWIDVEMYDALESDHHNNGKNESRYAENDYFSDAVCLNSRGKIQARAMGESLKYINLPIGSVHSSVSCRSRQTADLAFGGYEKLHRILVHKGPYNENETTRVNKLKELYSNFPLEGGKNTIVSAHNSVIDCNMFINNKCPKGLKLEEGGFYVIRNTKDGLLFEHEFHNFQLFIKQFYER